MLRLLLSFWEELVGRRGIRNNSTCQKEIVDARYSIKIVMYNLRFNQLFFCFDNVSPPKHSPFRLHTFFKY